MSIRAEDTAQAYVVMSHGKYLGIGPTDSIWGAVFGPWDVEMWRDEIRDATIYGFSYEAAAKARKLNHRSSCPCATVRPVALSLG